MIIIHNLNDLVLGEDRHRAFIAEYQFIFVLQKVAFSANAKIDSPANAINFITFICHTFRNKIPQAQRENIIKLSQYLYKFIDIKQFFNTRELVFGMKASGLKNRDIVKELGFNSRSMVNYYLQQSADIDIRTHINRWGQLLDIETFLLYYHQFMEAMNGQSN